MTQVAHHCGLVVIILKVISFLLGAIFATMYILFMLWWAFIGCIYYSISHFFLEKVSNNLICMYSLNAMEVAMAGKYTYKLL